MAIEPLHSIQSNFTANRAGRVLSENMLLLQKSLARLSSGLRIISPSDDPGGLAASITLGDQITRVTAAQTNLSNATSFSETQSGFLAKVQEALDRMSELAVLSQDSLVSDEDRSEYQVEFEELQEFISDIGTKSFNSINLFSATAYQVTVDQDGNKFAMNAIDLTASTAAGGILQSYDSGTVVSTTTAAATAQTIVEDAITNLGLLQAKVGANIARLDLHNDTLSSLSENLTMAKDRITNVDIATESTQYAVYELLVNSGTSMLAQANLLPQSLLLLLPDQS